MQILSEIHDVTCRDGNHALRHAITPRQVSDYVAKGLAAGIKSFEIGHGNGLGGSSSLVGKSLHEDLELLEAALAVSKEARIGVHSMPSFSTFKRDLRPAADLGVSYFRVGAHCTEMDTIEQHSKALLDLGKDVAAAVMMISHISLDDLARQMEKVSTYGVGEVVLMDSVGRLSPADVNLVVSTLKREFGFKVGFHAHNNLGLATANSISALDTGADYIDASILGMGAGAGNASLELIVLTLYTLGKLPDDSVKRVIKLADAAEKEMGFKRPLLSSITAATAFANLFSGFAPVIERAAALSNRNSLDLAFETLGKKLVAGQENLIYKIADEMNLGQ